MRYDMRDSWKCDIPKYSNMKCPTRARYRIIIFSCEWLKPIDVKRSLLRIVLTVALHSALFEGPKDQEPVLVPATLLEISTTEIVVPLKPFI
jgi:hypothetical protein